MTTTITGFHYTDECILTEKERQIIIKYLRNLHMLDYSVTDNELFMQALAAEKAEGNPIEAAERLYDKAINLFEVEVPPTINQIHNN